MSNCNKIEIVTTLEMSLYYWVKTYRIVTLSKNDNIKIVTDHFELLFWNFEVATSRIVAISQKE